MAGRRSVSLVYKHFRDFAEKWPLDLSRKDKDIGEYIRTFIVPKMYEGKVKEKDARLNLAAIEQLSTDYYRKKYPRVEETNFTGKAPKESQTVTSDAGLQFFQKRQRTILQRLRLQK